jgi:hypothetical protein
VQRVICSELEEFYWRIHHNLLFSHRDSWFGPYILEKEDLSDIINRAKSLCLVALKMNESPFAILSKIRSMSVLSIITCFEPDFQLAEKYGLEAINKWEAYGEQFFEQCGRALPQYYSIVRETELDSFHEYQIVYGQYLTTLILQPEGEIRINKILEFLEIHPESIFKWSLDSSAPTWTSISDLPDFEGMDKLAKRRIYIKWLKIAEKLEEDEDVDILTRLLADENDTFTV